jgi:antitoxin VapB
MPLDDKSADTGPLACVLAERASESSTIATRREDLAAIRRRWSALPVRDRRSADEMVGYDERGLPR